MNIIGRYLSENGYFITIEDLIEDFYSISMGMSDGKIVTSSYSVNISKNHLDEAVDNIEIEFPEERLLRISNVKTIKEENENNITITQTFEAGFNQNDDEELMVKSETLNKLL